MTATNLLGWCASAADLPRACADLSEFLALQRRRTEARSEPLFGLWVDPRWGERIPCELLWREADGKSGTAYIRETAGVNGIWMLCWIEVPPAAPRLTRRALLASLAAAFGAPRADPPPAFVPVFPLDAPASDVRTELQRLTTEHADLMLAPLYQDVRSGRLQTAALLPQTVELHPGASRRCRSRRQRLH
ncbi:MAG: hypothetical protein AMXMBFR66_02710 [Pseudomonadota bacterium]